MSSSSIGAQPAPPVIQPVSVDASGTSPVGKFNGNPAVSDTGAVVAFDASDLVAGTDRRVWIRDRTAATTRPVAEVLSRAPGISGNGCLVAYSVPGGSPTEPTRLLTVVDRCSSPSGALPAGKVIGTTSAVGNDSAPALSFDGSTIVWSTGSEIRRYVRPTANPAPVAPAAIDHVLVDSFDAALIPTVGIVTGAELDVSDDGTAIVYVAGPGASPFAPAPGNVYVWSLPAGAVTPTIEVLSRTAVGAPGTASSGSPTLSGDGSLVFFDSSSRDLAAVGTNPVTVPFVVYVDRVGQGTRVLVDDASRPAVSADGMHVVYERAGAIRLVSSTSGPTYATTTDRAVGGLETANPLTGSAISQHGRWIVFDSANGASLTLDVKFHAGIGVWAADQRPSNDGSVDTTTTTTTTVPGSGSGSATTTTTPSTGPPVAVLPPSATTVPSSTGSPSTGPRPTVPTSTLPRYTFPSYNFPSSSTTYFGGSTGSTTVRSSTIVQGGPIVQPVVFEPTVVAAGRRTATATLSNPSTRSVTVVGVRVDSANSGAFTLLTDNCTGVSLPSGTSCTVEVQFAPIAVGPANGLLIFGLADGAIASAELVGDGSAIPTLDVVPGVAAPGQVVTVFGAGFPAGVIVEFSRSGVADVTQLTVEADGTFAHVFVVLPNTPSGPMTLTVAAQPDSFAAVTGELLVSSRSSDSNTAAFRNVGSSLRG